MRQTPEEPVDAAERERRRTVLYRLLETADDGDARGVLAELRELRRLDDEERRAGQGNVVSIDTARRRG